MHINDVFIYTVTCFLAPSSVLAGGYGGCVERVLAFQAYEIDALNPPSQQRMGFKCDNWQDKPKPPKCIGKWVPCRGSNPGGRCTFWEFCESIGKIPNAKPQNWFVGQPGAPNRMDHEKMSKICYDQFTTRNTKINNFAAFKTIKDIPTNSFNEYILEQAAIVDRTAQVHRNAGNAHLWEDFDNCRGHALTSRIGDHGEHLVQAAEKDLGLKLTRMNLGPHPSNPGADFYTLDWKQTAIDAKKANIPFYKNKLVYFHSRFYGGKSAGDHQATIRAYKHSSIKSRRCR